MSLRATGGWFAAALLCVGLAPLPLAAGEVLDSNAVPAQLVVTLAEPVHKRQGRGGRYSGKYVVPDKFARIVRQLAREYALVEKNSWPIGSIGVHCVVYEVSADADADALAESLAQDKRVGRVQRLNYFEVLGQRGQKQQPDYDDPLLPLQQGLAQMQLVQAHRWADGRGVKVAVIDTAIDRDHPDLKGRLKVTRNFVDRQRYPPAERHATAVAGVIGAHSGNGLGIVGVAPQAQLLALRACWQTDASGTEARCNTVTLARALDYAIEKQSDVINMSLAGPADALLADLVRVAIDRGAVVVAAAREPLEQSFPASMAQVIGVVAAGREGAAVAPLGNIPALLAAPGVDVMTTVPGGEFAFVSGSSIAAAHVSGLVALLRQRHRHMSGPDILARISATATHMSDNAASVARPVNACRALADDGQPLQCPHAASAALERPPNPPVVPNS